MRRLPTFPVVLAGVAAFLDLYSTQPLLPLLRDTFGASTFEAGLTITAPTIASISVTPDDLTLGIGIGQQYTATAVYSDGSTQDLTSGVTWSSSATSVATPCAAVQAVLYGWAN